MGPPFYDFSRIGSIVSICCSKEENLDEVTQEEPELDTFGTRNSQSPPAGMLKTQLMNTLLKEI